MVFRLAAVICLTGKTEMLPENRVKSQRNACNSSVLWSDAMGSVLSIWLTSKGWHCVRLVQSAVQTCRVTILHMHSQMDSATWTKWPRYTAVFLTILDLICAFFFLLASLAPFTCFLSFLSFIHLGKKYSEPKWSNCHTSKQRQPKHLMCSI